MFKNLITIFCLLVFSGCSSSHFISTKQQDRIKDLNREIENSRVKINQHTGKSIKARNVTVSADSVFYFKSGLKSLSVKEVSSIEVDSNLNILTVLGVSLSGAGIYHLATASSAEGVYEPAGKRVLGIGFLLLGLGSLAPGLHFFKQTYHIY